MKINKLSIVKEWSKKADEDLLTIKILIREKGPIDSICFHAQQAAEKYLKALRDHEFLAVLGFYKLYMLLNICNEIGLNGEDLGEVALELTKYYVETRYPAEVPLVKFSEGKKALVRTEKIIKLIKEKIKS